MKNLITPVAALALLLPLFVHHSYSHAKQLPPAFGKELVPDKSSQESMDPSDSEIQEEKQERRERPPAQTRRGRGQKLRIQLDGDEDGGGVDEGDDGEF